MGSRCEGLIESHACKRYGPPSRRLGALIVAGSLVNEQGRDVEAMINIADVFQLFGELAGIDVHDVVPSSRQLDSVSLLPYLESPAQQPIRGINSTQLDANIEPIAYEVPPCVLPLGSESRRNERAFIRVNPEPGPASF